MRASRSLLILVFALTATKPSLALADDAPASKPPPERSAAPAPDDSRQLRFTSGVSLTGIGVISLIVSGVMGARALVSKNQIGTHCPPSNQCDLVGYTLGSEARDFALISTVMFGVGLGVTVPGVVLLVSGVPKARPTPATSAWIGVAARGLAFNARW